MEYYFTRTRFDLRSLERLSFPRCHIVWFPHAVTSAMRAMEDTGVSILLVGYEADTHASGHHRQDYMEQEVRTTLQILNRQDLEAGTGFAVHFGHSLW